MLSVLKDLADADPSELGEEFGTTLIASTDRLRTKLVGLQAEAPNTWKAVHTLIAFRVSVAEFNHRLHMYQDQGFFDDALSEAAMFVTESHVLNVEGYIHMDYAAVLLGLVTVNQCTKDHPIVTTFQQDKAGIKGNFAANKNLGLDDAAVKDTASERFRLRWRGCGASSGQEGGGKKGGGRRAAAKKSASSSADEMATMSAAHGHSPLPGRCGLGRARSPDG